MKITRQTALQQKVWDVTPLRELRASYFFAVRSSPHVIARFRSKYSSALVLYRKYAIFRSLRMLARGAHAAKTPKSLGEPSLTIQGIMRMNACSEKDSGLFGCQQCSQLKLKTYC